MAQHGFRRKMAAGFSVTSVIIIALILHSLCSEVILPKILIALDVA